MPALEISTATDGDIDAIVALWTRCDLTRPWNDARADIALARSGANATILVGRTQGKIAAAVMAGHDGHRGWFYYLAVDPDLRGRGYGRAMTQAAEQWLTRARHREGDADGTAGQHQGAGLLHGARLFRPAARGAGQMAGWA